MDLVQQRGRHLRRPDHGEPAIDGDVRKALLGVGAGMGGVAAWLAVPVGRRVAPGPCTGFVIVATLGREALVVGTGLDQGAIHREVVFAEQFALVRQGLPR